MRTLRERVARRAALVEALLRYTIHAPCVGYSLKARARLRACHDGYVRYDGIEYEYAVARITSAGRAELARMNRAERDTLIASVIGEAFAAAFREVEIALMRRGERVDPLPPQIHARYAVVHHIPTLRGPL